MAIKTAGRHTWKSYWEGTDKSFIERQIQLYKAKRGYGRLLQVVPEVERGGRVLEVGAGKAWLSRILRAKGWHTVAIDLEPEVARANFNKVDNYIIGDMRKLPFKDNYFDLVISSGLIEHFDLSTVQRIILEMRRVGKAIVAWFPTCGTEWKLMWLFRNILGGSILTQVHRHKRGDIRDILLSSGLDNVRTGTVFFGGILRYVYVYGKIRRALK